MEAVQLVHTGGVARVDVHSVRRVRPAVGQVLVRVRAVALHRADAEMSCGAVPLTFASDGRRTLGRHVVGTVAAPGAGVDGWRLGGWVALTPARTRRGWFDPGVSHHGGMADYVVAPVEGLVPLPSGVDPSVAVRAAVAARALTLLEQARTRPGESVGVWGAGALGAAAVAVARALGAAPVVAVDPAAAARAAAEQLGADVCFSPTDPDLRERIRALTNGRGLDVALHLAPDRSAAPQAYASLHEQGRAVLAGPAAEVCADRWDARTVCGPARTSPSAVGRALRLTMQDRMALPAWPTLRGGWSEASALLDAAVHNRRSVPPSLVLR